MYTWTQKGHFRRISFERLPPMGCRRWSTGGGYSSRENRKSVFHLAKAKNYPSLPGTVARLHCAASADVAFSPLPEAAASKSP